MSNFRSNLVLIDQAARLVRYAQDNPTAEDFEQMAQPIREALAEQSIARSRVLDIIARINLIGNSGQASTHNLAGLSAEVIQKFAEAQSRIKDVAERAKAFMADQNYSEALSVLESAMQDLQFLESAIQAGSQLSIAQKAI